MFRIAFLTLLAAATPAWAQLKWDKPWQEFQRSPEDKSIEVQFTFKNAGASKVAIKNVKSSCGCTTAKLSKNEFAPGEGGDLNAKFTFGDRKGAQRKMITVTMDDGTKQELNFVVRIQEAVTLEPALVLWRIGQPGEVQKVLVNIEAGKKVPVKSVTSSNPRIEAKLETVKAGEQYAVVIKPVDTANKEKAEITVQTDWPTDAPRAYTIHARVK